MSSDPLEDDRLIYDPKRKRLIFDPTPRGLPKYPSGLQNVLLRRSDRLGEVVYPIADKSHELLLRTVAVARAIEANPDSDDPVIEAMLQRNLDDAKWLAEESRSLVEEKRHLFEFYPGNPVTIFSNAKELKLTDGAILPPGRLLLDVTDATLSQVKEIWPSVYWKQIIQEEKGNSQKRMPGRPPGPATEKTRHWVGLSRTIGEKKALNRFKKKLGRWQGNWIAGYQWWYRNVRRHLNK